VWGQIVKMPFCVGATVPKMPFCVGPHKKELYLWYRKLRKDALQRQSGIRLRRNVCVGNLWLRKSKPKPKPKPKPGKQANTKYEFTSPVTVLQNYCARRARQPNYFLLTQERSFVMGPDQAPLRHYQDDIDFMYTLCVLESADFLRATIAL
jgi:hypothetical protein